MTSGLWPDIRAALDGEFWFPAGTLITANGTAVPYGDGPGFPADLARNLMAEADGMWVWRWLNYPAATFPMRPSIAVLKGVLREAVRTTPGHQAWAAYSQSAIAFAEVWRDDVLNPAGELHDRLDDIVEIWLYGDPTRTPGIAYGNEVAGLPAPGKLDGKTTGGIAGPGCLRPEHLVHPRTGRRIVMSVAKDGDLFASAPVGDTPWIAETEVGHNQTLVFEAVQDFNGRDIMGFAREVTQIVSMPLTQVVPLVQAIWNGLRFLGQGMNAPHWTLDARPATRHLIDVGARLRAAP